MGGLKNHYFLRFMTPDQRLEYLQNILLKTENWEANFFELARLLKGYVQAEIEIIELRKTFSLEETDEGVIRINSTFRNL